MSLTVATLLATVLALATPDSVGPSSTRSPRANPTVDTDSSSALERGAVGARPDTLALADSLAGDTLSFRLNRVATVIGRGEGRGQVLQPAGIAIDHFGKLYVTDAALHRLQRFDENGGFLGEAGALGSGEGQMRRPGAVAALGTLSIAVLDRENRRVLSYDLFGRLHGTLIDLEDPTLEDVLGRVDPVDLAADRGGSVTIADAERDRLLVFDFSGRYLRTLGGLGARPGSFRGLAGVALGRRGELITSERLQGRIQRLDSSGRSLAAWALPVRSSRAALPVAVDDSGRVAVGDEAAGTIRVFDASGALIARLEGLEGPRALAFDRDGSLLVAEAAAGRVRRLVLVANAGRSQPKD